MICRHILDHLELHNILSMLQHGFHGGRSCETQLRTILQDFLMNCDKETQVEVAILDFAKAFDTMPRDKLLSKLQHYGIRSDIHAWIFSFLKGHTQSVVVDSSRSDSASVISGVPRAPYLYPFCSCYTWTTCCWMSAPRYDCLQTIVYFIAQSIPPKSKRYCNRIWEA